jgi:hypothetical protein
VRFYAEKITQRRLITIHFAKKIRRLVLVTDVRMRIRIQIQHFRSMRIRIQIQGFDDQKSGKNLQLKKVVFFDEKFNYL